MEKLFKGVYSTMYRGHLVEIELRPLSDFSYDAVYRCRVEADDAVVSHKGTHGTKRIRTVDEYHALVDALKAKLDALVDGSEAKPPKAPFSFQYRIRT